MITINNMVQPLIDMTDEERSIALSQLPPTESESSEEPNFHTQRSIPDGRSKDELEEDQCRDWSRELQQRHFKRELRILAAKWRKVAGRKTALDTTCVLAAQGQWLDVCFELGRIRGKAINPELHREIEALQDVLSRGSIVKPMSRTKAWRKVEPGWRKGVVIVRPEWIARSLNDFFSWCTGETEMHYRKDESSLRPKQVHSLW